MSFFVAAVEHQLRTAFAALRDSALYRFGWCYEQADDYAEVAREGLCEREEEEEVSEPRSAPRFPPCPDSDKCSYCPVNDGLDCTQSCVEAKQDWLDDEPTAWVDHDYEPMPRNYEDVPVKITPVEGSGVPPTAPSTGGTDPSPTTGQAATTVGDEGGSEDCDIHQSPSAPRPDIAYLLTEADVRRIARDEINEARSKGPW
jgi:hypothetical protein